MRKSFVPLRDFIYDRLYHPKLGYFCKKGILWLSDRLPTGRVEGTYKFQEVDWVWRLPEVTRWKVPQKRMAHSMRNIQALLRYDNCKLYSDSAWDVWQEGAGWREDQHCGSRCRYRQRGWVHIVLFQELRPEVVLKDLLHNRWNLTRSMPANHWKTLSLVPHAIREQSDKNHQRWYHELQDQGTELCHVFLSAR